MIAKPGIYYDFDISKYYADPCPAPSITQSLAKVLLERSPLHAWWQHPRLNKTFEREDKKKFDKATVAHRIFLGRGREISVIKDFDDWRTKASQEARDEAIALGKIPCLEKVFTEANAMAIFAHRSLRRSIDWSVKHGNAEVCLAWKELAEPEPAPVWCRQLVDWLESDNLMFLDYKTTEMSAAPQNLANRMIDGGWHLQAAMTDRALAVLAPKHAGRRRYLFAVQECEPPHEVCLCEIGEAALDLGRRLLDHAIAVWSSCMVNDHWPGYPTTPVVPLIPAWHMNKLFELELPNMPRPIDMDDRRFIDRIV